MTLKYNILWTFFTQIHLKVPAPCITENSKEDDTQLTGKHERGPWEQHHLFPHHFSMDKEHHSYYIAIY